MRNREQNREFLVELARQLGLQANALPLTRAPLSDLHQPAAEIEWSLPLQDRLNISVIRQFIPDFPEAFPLAGLTLIDDSDRPARHFHDLGMLSSHRYAYAFLVTHGAKTYRAVHRSLRTFRHLFGAGNSLVADIQQLRLAREKLDAGNEHSFDEIREPPFADEWMAAEEIESAGDSQPKTWTMQAKHVLRLKGQEARLKVSENALPIDFARQFDGGMKAFATVQQYLQPVLLEEIGHALGYYHSFTPIENRPPRTTTSWAKQFAPIKLDVIWRMSIPSGLQQLLYYLFSLDFALRHAVPLLHGPQLSLPLMGFNIERSISSASAGRMLMLGRGCRFGFVIVPPSQLEAAQKMLALLSKSLGLSNIRVLNRNTLFQFTD